jgi:hypothetical protein
MACDYIKVLNLAQSEKWDEAHYLIQQYSDQYSCLIHGYLHRVEGDLANAHYWYGRSKSDMPINSLEEEFDRLCSLIESRSA